VSHQIFIPCPEYSEDSLEKREKNMTEGIIEYINAINDDDNALKSIATQYSHIYWRKNRKKKKMHILTKMSRNSETWIS